MRAERIFDLVVWLFIAAVGLVTAYVCFGILSSEASGRFQQYSVGGALAGAVVSWSLLTSVYLQLRGSSKELEDLRNRTEELQNKLIRGAPRPQGFDTEVDERQRIVLARPRNWQPKGGTVFDLELAAEEMRKDDTFAAAFRCYFVPIEKDSTPTKEKFYEGELELFAKASDYVSSYSHEIVRLGGEPAGIESLKIIARQFVRTLIKTSPDTRLTETRWEVVSRNEFVGEVFEVDPFELTVGRPTKVTLRGMGFRKGAVCYVNRSKRETEVVNGFTAKATLLDEDVDYPRVLEFALENPDAAGLRTRPFTVMVTQRGHGEEPTELVPQEPSTTEEKAMQDSATEKPSVAGDPFGGAEEKEVFQEIARMRVLCYHEALEKIYIFEFLDDVGDFKDSSARFNRVLASVRFLD